MQSIQIKNKELKIKEFNGQRVVTFRDIDEVHQRPQDTARKCFNRNKKHFVQNEDYCVLKTDEAKSLYDVKAPTGLILLTESGYLMLVKSFTDDLAWEVQRALVNNYFRKPEPKTTLDISIEDVFGNIKANNSSNLLRIMTLEQELSRLKALHYDYSVFAETAEKNKKAYRKKYENFRGMEDHCRSIMQEIKTNIHVLEKKIDEAKKEGTMYGSNR